MVRLNPVYESYVFEPENLVEPAQRSFRGSLPENYAHLFQFNPEHLAVLDSIFDKGQSLVVFKKVVLRCRVVQKPSLSD